MYCIGLALVLAKMNWLLNWEVTLVFSGSYLGISMASLVVVVSLGPNRPFFSWGFKMYIKSTKES